MNLVIVESPAKAKTINKYLGSSYKVIASFGHVRDLPSKDGAVEPDNDFAMHWEVDQTRKAMKDIQAAMKSADKLILATDPDREGEAISWHILQVLNEKKLIKKGMVVERVAFNAITKQAILKAMSEPRQIDGPLVDAYLARRALDYLVGFNLSPVLWRKLPGARSAGRVQSVSLRLVCDRELEIEKFIRREYWSLAAHLLTKDKAPFTARLTGADGRKIARLDIGGGEEARNFETALNEAKFSVASVEAKPARRNPWPPFTTSTLQQDASRKLGLAPARTMQLAQRLYEGVDIGGERVGLITYMRTDGVDMAPEAIASARAVIGGEYGPKYVPSSPRVYTTKQKTAQEAHEAIRPTDMARLPKQVSKYVDREQLALYDLIWTRTIASQMASAELERTTVDITADVPAPSPIRKIDLRATGQVVRFDGFLALYQEGKDDEEDEESGRLPPMAQGDALAKEKIEAIQHFTEPPPRFTEATLVKRMEELGIGRPSTYASTLAVLRERDYVKIEKKRLIPEDKGRLLTAFLESFFARYVEYNFTADLEEKLDLVANHEADWKQLLRDFWKEFSAAVDATKDLRTTQVLDNLNEVLGAHIFPAKEDGSNPRACPSCGTGQISLKLGKFGAFIGCSNYPECKFTRTMSQSAAGEASGVEGGDRPGVKVLGQFPATGEEVSLRDGRFGAYVQLAEGEKPKRSSLPKSMKASELTLEQAIGLLSLPREVAKHPESGEPIRASIGRFGPYVQHAKTFASLGRDDDVLTIGANRAIDLIVTKEQGGGKGRFGQAAPGRALGDHPSGGAISVKEGRFGPYVNHGKVNANVPRGTDPGALTLAEAIALIDARASGAPSGGGRLLGVHPQGGPITVRDGRFGAYVNHGKVNAPLRKDQTPEDISLQDAVDLIEAKGGPVKPAKKAAGKKTSAKKPAAKAKAAPAKKAARDRGAAPSAAAPAKKAAAKPTARAPAKRAAANKPAGKKAPAKKAKRK